MYWLLGICLVGWTLSIMFGVFVILSLYGQTLQLAKDLEYARETARGGLAVRASRPEGVPRDAA